jgi:ATP-dependent helicase Lhr and Lhr-like helicase
VLLITPESLEAMMMSRRVPARELLGSVRAVVIDEVHAFADDDRGAHLSALLERLTRFCGRDVQRIGLSATVGNPEEILAWLQGSSRRPQAFVNPPKPPRSPDIELDYVAHLHNAALVIKTLHPGKKRLVFVDSRRSAEELGKLLLEQDVTAHVIHGSLSVSQRRDAERAFEHGQDCVIVATSALELGIDVGDLDHVLQIDSPPSVASFLQRMGRTGRRPDTVSNCTFLLTKEDAMLRAAAVIRLFRAGFVEAVRPSRRAAHIYAHQVMALVIQGGGMNRIDIAVWLRGVSAFQNLTPAECDSILDHMVHNEILSEDAGRLSLGSEGEKRYGRANFRELYAVFDVPRLVSVHWNLEELGTVDAKFLMSLHSEEQGFGSFVLGARPWQIKHVDWERGRCIVEPAPDGRAARWNGSPRYLSYELCQTMKALLLGADEDPAWSSRAKHIIEGARAAHAFLDPEGTTFLESPEEVTWHTYAGGAANQLLARMLEHAIPAPPFMKQQGQVQLTAQERAVESSAFTTLTHRKRPAATDSIMAGVLPKVVPASSWSSAAASRRWTKATSTLSPAARTVRDLPARPRRTLCSTALDLIP